MRASLFPPAIVAALVGYGSTIALVLSAAAALDASERQTASWVFAICIAKALGSAWLSWQTRVPVVLAWSTPGAALIAASEGLSMAQGVASFVATGAMIALTGLWRPLGTLVARIPDAVAAAMLAGVLLPFCLRGVASAQGLPGVVLPMVAVFLAVRLRNPAMAVLAALGAGLALAFALGYALPPVLTLPLPAPVLIRPDPVLDAILGLALPLYLVTMASQNLPGFATLRAAGYEPPVRPALAGTGALSALAGLFGAHTVSMAAITAAICLTEDAHPDRTQRWKVGLAYGLVWLALGFFSPPILAILAALPSELMSALVALALLAPLTGALSGAYTHPERRFAATMTLAVTASGVAALGIGAAFWGLVAGVLVAAVDRGARAFLRG